jgi:hypothetical protein
MSEIIQYLNSFAEKAVQSNKPEDWSSLSYQITKISNIIDKPFDIKNFRYNSIKPYDFNFLKREDFHSYSKEYIDKIEELTKLKFEFVMQQKYEQAAIHRVEEQKLIEKMIIKNEYRFSDYSFFKKIKENEYVHLFKFRI